MATEASENLQRGVAAYNQIFKEAKEDKNILGLILAGSRGKGLHNKHSDFDILLIVRHNPRQYERKYCEYCIVPNQLGVEIGVLDLPSFRKYAEFGSRYEWDRYSFAHIKARLDKTGEIQKLIDEKSRIPESKIRQFTRGALDAYINSVFRSLKCKSDGNKICARLEAIKEIPLFITVLFALDGRVSPYYKYLEWELTEYPIKQFPMTSREILLSIMRLADSADCATQQELLGLCHQVFDQKGYGGVFKDWGHNMQWMETARF